MNELTKMAEVLESLNASFERLKASHEKQEGKKVIDLSVLIKSGIDCALWDEGDSMPRIAPLLELTTGRVYKYLGTAEAYRYCTPRMTPHVHYWAGGECPLPEGFVVKLYFRNNTTCVTGDYIGMEWGADHPNRIIGFEVLLVVDGWKLPFDVEAE